MTVSLIRWMRRATFLLAMLGGAAQANAQTSGSSLVIAFHARPGDRPALRAQMEAVQAARLKQWKADGLLSGYRLFFTRYADKASWDAMEILSFRDVASLIRWGAMERAGAGGLTPDALKLVRSVDTTPVDLAVGGGARDAVDPSVLVIPYVSLVPKDEYLRYLQGYTVPQFQGWIAEGVLDGYDILTGIYPAGRAWNALIVLRYKDDAALARREEVVTRVRARLAANPAWKAISDNKKAVRSEGVVSIADQITASDDK